MVLELSTLPLSDLPDGWVVGSITYRYWIATAAPEYPESGRPPKGKTATQSADQALTLATVPLAAIALISGGLILKRIACQGHCRVGRPHDAEVGY